MKKVALITILLLLVFVVDILFSTGTFRKIENRSNWIIEKKIGIPGAEDITVSAADSFALISSTLRASFPQKEEEYGAIYYMDLKTEEYAPKNLTSFLNMSFAPHGISILKIGDKYRVLAINHSRDGHTIEAFTLTGDCLIHERTFKDPSITSPNDIVIIDERRFYFTNDHGHTKGFRRLAEEYLGLSLSNVVYYDGSTFTKAATGIAYANGINFDSQRNLLYVASPRKFLIKVYSKIMDGTLEFVEDIPCGTGVDNIELDDDGNLFVGAHPKLLRFGAYAKGDEAISPSEIIKVNYNSKGNYTVESIYTENGSTMSASTVAAPFENFLFVGNVKDSKFLVLKKEID